MLRLSLPTTRPTLRILHTHLPCLHFLNQSPASGLKGLSKSKSNTKKQATPRADVTAPEKKRRKRADKRAEEEDLVAQNMPDFVRQALRIPDPNSEKSKDELGSTKEAHPEPTNAEDQLPAIEDLDPSPDSQSVSAVKLKDLHLWNELLATSSDKLNEMLPILRKGYGGDTRRKAIGDVRRINIVGEDLCDVILERMKPSLEKHKGCDIIDVNPGIGVWSSKLHEYLKPRTHILMEPDVKLYQPMLQPLLDAKDSKYVLFPKPGVIWAHLERVLSEKYLPHQKSLPHGDPRLEQPNDTLLFVANLSYHPKKHFKAFESLTSLVLYQLMSAIRSHALFHKYGTIRMLIWIVDDEKKLPLPRHIAMRKKSSIEAEISCGKVVEIASSTRAVGAFRRDDDLEQKVAIKVLENMEKLGITTPVGRESQMQKFLMTEGNEADRSSPADDDKVGLQYRHRQAELEAKFAAGKFQKFATVRRAPKTEKKPRIGNKGRPSFEFEITPEWQLLTTYRIRRATEDHRKAAVLGFIERNDEIMKMQREIYDLEKGPDYDARREELFQIMAKFKDDVAMIPGKETRIKVITYIDNQRLSMQDTPGFLFDRRESEPLKVEQHEFYPHQELAFLDFQPQAIWPILRQDFPANYDIFEYILLMLLNTPSTSIDSALKSLWPGASDWMLERCPTLTNPHKGGDMDLTRLPVRCLSTQMLKEIMEAWMSWPWRPSRHELIGRLTVYSSLDLEDSMTSDNSEGTLS